MKRIAILGSTGSIGHSTLSVVESYPERFQIVALAAGGNLEAAFEQARRWHPRVISMATEANADTLRSRLKREGLNEIEVVHGAAGTVRVATHPEVDFVVSAIVGVAGLEATYEAVRAGKILGLANKECLVAAGELITAEARKQGTQLLPIDSEHNAVHQCLRGGRMEEVERVWLTASGGPFLNTPRAQFASITVEQALNHPTWKMGRRITIDSATLMNKGFEVIEACRLFHIPPEKVEVIVHPQSTIHSMVEFVDGSILAQVSVTDMRLPILYALTYPERVSSDMRFPVSDLRHLDFCQPDLKKFPCLRLAYEAVEAGGAKTVALNAADEVAVAAFLEGRIRFDQIPRIIEDVLAATNSGKLESIRAVLETDADARQCAHRQVALSNADVKKPKRPRATSLA
ncbi:1-deoxy-D-xylulose 5-phosphate reductoisomerase [Candidatus Sulfotelmatobacter kueseliae]|uniref:1-deoxy-D-xylulose 5-phosphate reductoisomerase n=1 Tax=Candidatus Sulfotelmatobacter kueseliae TaxID=2042962 RepID=A0A2U3KTY4_9BACT|nr:1-deoxy-D-xylulose 5-phosphate reductoisomerase [Candidatus Sulfotelmatobacter kueseliae]